MKLFAKSDLKGSVMFSVILMNCAIYDLLNLTYSVVVQLVSLHFQKKIHVLGCKPP